jgi:hypothetical protein
MNAYNYDAMKNFEWSKYKKHTETYRGDILGGSYVEDSDWNASSYVVAVLGEV